MQVFVSWSGSLSRSLALHLTDWIKAVVQRTDPWMSHRDIEAGSQWNSELTRKLGTTDFGVICITPDNLNAPWILFEAGALSKSVENARVVPVLFGVEATDLLSPLSQFQSVPATKDGFLSLVTSINSALGDQKLEASSLGAVFEGMWDAFGEKIEETLAREKRADPKVERTDRELIEETLEIVRRFQRDGGDPRFVLEKAEHNTTVWEEYYLKAVNLANARGTRQTNIEALEYNSLAIANLPDPASNPNMVARLYGYRAALFKRLGRVDEGLFSAELAMQLSTEDREIQDAAYNSVCLLIMDNQLDAAIPILERLLEANINWAPILKNGPYISNALSDQRFRKLLGF